jgi:hypothetical protein
MVDASYARYELSGFDRQLMMNKSLLDEGQESSDKEYYGFRAHAEKDAGRADPTQRWQGAAQKKAAGKRRLRVDNREASNRVDRSHSVSKRGQC